MSNPMKSLTKIEWWVWIGSLLIIILSNVLSVSFDLLTLIASCIGVTTITWIRNPSASGKEVEIQTLTIKHVCMLILSAVIVTAVFFQILAALNTPNIIFSTISVTTSFFAASLTMLRSSYYAVGYAANDIVLIVLWGLAALKDSRYISVIVIFVIFFFYDLYGFVSWKQRERKLCG